MFNSNHCLGEKKERYELIPGTEKLIPESSACSEVPVSSPEISSSNYVYFPQILAIGQFKVIQQKWVEARNWTKFLGVGVWVDDLSVPTSTRTIKSVRPLDGIYFEQKEDCEDFIQDYIQDYRISQLED